MSMGRPRGRCFMGPRCMGSGRSGLVHGVGGTILCGTDRPRAPDVPMADRTAAVFHAWRLTAGRPAKPPQTQRLDWPCQVSWSGLLRCGSAGPPFGDAGEVAPVVPPVQLEAPDLLAGPRTRSAEAADAVSAGPDDPVGPGQLGSHYPQPSPWSVYPAAISAWSSGPPQMVHSPSPRGVSDTCATSATALVTGRAEVAGSACCPLPATGAPSSTCEVAQVAEVALPPPPGGR